MHYLIINCCSGNFNYSAEVNSNFLIIEYLNIDYLVSYHVLICLLENTLLAKSALNAGKSVTCAFLTSTKNPKMCNRKQANKLLKGLSGRL